MDRPVLLKHQLYTHGRQNAMKVCGMWSEQHWNQHESFILYQWIRPYTELGRSQEQNTEIRNLLLPHSQLGCRLSSAPCILNGPSCCHLSRREKSLLVWANGCCIRAVVSGSTGKPVVKLGRLAGNKPESNPSGHNRLGLTYLKIMVYTDHISL